MTMNANDYHPLKEGCYCSAGKFGGHIYAFEVLTGVCDVPAYHQITREEFDTFETWCMESPVDGKLLCRVINRPVFCSRYRGKSEFDETLLPEKPVEHVAFSK